MPPHSSSKIKTIPAIALTAYAGPDNRKQALLAGFDAFLTKPLDFVQLVSSLEQLLWPC